MAHIPFDEAELLTCGIYTNHGTWYGFDFPDVERLTPPITPEENLKRYMTGGEYEWIPDLNSDQVDYTPANNLDIDASDFTGGYDAFGVKWIPVEGDSGLPAFVEPGFCVLKDIEDWEKMEWPKPQNWGLDDDAKAYTEFYKNDDRMKRGVIVTGYFERLISIMTFEEAAIAMITDPESVNAFFEKLTEFNLYILDNYIDKFQCGAIKMHDDWSAQKAPFFAPDVARELIAPHVKKLVDRAHEKGVVFTHHSCGNGSLLLPVYKAEGIDAWNAQYNAFENLNHTIEDAAPELKLEINQELPSGIHGEELEKAIYEIMDKCCSGHKCLVKFIDPDSDRQFESRKLIYKVGRKLALEGK